MGGNGILGEEEMKLYSSKQIKSLFGYSQGTSITDVVFQNPGVVKKICQDCWVFQKNLDGKCKGCGKPALRHDLCPECRAINLLFDERIISRELKE